MSLQFWNVQSQKLGHLIHWPETFRNNLRVDVEEQNIHMEKVWVGQDVWFFLYSSYGGLLKEEGLFLQLVF